MNLNNDFLIENDILKRYNVCDTEVIVPDNVAVIGEGAFEECSFIKSIVISQGVKIIDEWAFCNCDDLVSVSIPDSVEIIWDNAFYNCENLSVIKDISSAAVYGAKGANGVVIVKTKRPVTKVMPGMEIIVSLPQSSKNGKPARIVLPPVDSRSDT